MATKIQMRRGTSSQWGDSNPVLAAGEPAIESDTLRMKVGNGASNYSKLKYINERDENNLFLSQVWLTDEFFRNFNEESESDCNGAFNQMAEYFCGNLMYHGIEGKHLSCEVYDYEGTPLGKFGPGLSKADIMRSIKDVGYEGSVGMGKGVQIIFYIETSHGATPHLVLYNDLYGAILDKDFKNTGTRYLFRNQPSQEGKTTIKFFYEERFNYTITNELMSDALDTFKKVSRERAYYMYDPRECRPGINSSHIYYETDGGSKGIKRVEEMGEEYKDMHLGRDSNWYILWLKNKNTGVIKRVMTDYPVSFPDFDEWEEEEPSDYEVRGPIIIYEFQGRDDENGITYHKFRIGGCGANRLAYQSNSLAAEVGVDEDDEDKTVQLYVQYKYPSQREKVVITDQEFNLDNSYISSGRVYPFSIRLNTKDILYTCKKMKKSSRGQILCRFGFYNPRTNKFSKPTEWFKISLRHNGSPITASKLNKY